MVVRHGVIGVWMIAIVGHLGCQPETSARRGDTGEDTPVGYDAGTDVAMDVRGEDPGRGTSEDGGEPLDDPSRWVHAEGRWPAPEHVWTLPLPEEGQGYYAPDIQARFPDVDWATLDRLYIPAGHYKFLLIGNLPERSPERPLVITNQGGQVRVGGLDHYYLMSLTGGSNWVLTGRYDAQAATGHADYPGHKYGEYAHRAGTYGIMIDDEPSMYERGNNGIIIGGGATQFEVEFLEIRHIGFAGMNIKSNDEGSAHMEDVKLHDLYIHDILSEGLYIGSTQSGEQHQIRRFEIYNNRIVRVGTEAFQIGHVGGGDTRVYNNVFGPSAMDWRAAFQAFQDGNLQMGLRNGRLLIYDNVFIGGAGKWAEFFGTLRDGDVRQEGDGIYLENNYFSHVRNLGAYIHNGDISPGKHRIAGNVFRQATFSYDELDPDAAAPGHLIRINNTTTPIEIEDNIWESPGALSSRIAAGDGEQGNVVQRGNVQESVAPVAFRDFGVPPEFDFMTLEMWTDIATRGGDVPVSYEPGDIVTHYSGVYRCLLDPCPAGRVPAEHPQTWEELPAFADDVRLRGDSAHPHVGIKPPGEER